VSISTDKCTVSRKIILYETIHREKKYRKECYEIYDVTDSCFRRAVEGVGLRPNACWGRGFESHEGHGCFVSCECLCCQIEGLCDGPIPSPEEPYRLWCVSECDQVKTNNLDTYCESVGELRTTKRNGTKQISVYIGLRRLMEPCHEQRM
jgi:hypothetical protein